jgi:hypothetical protein
MPKILIKVTSIRGLPMKFTKKNRDLNAFVIVDLASLKKETNRTDIKFGEVSQLNFYLSLKFFEIALILSPNKNI